MALSEHQGLATPHPPGKGMDVAWQSRAFPNLRPDVTQLHSLLSTAVSDWIPASQG